LGNSLADPLSPVRRVGLDLREETASNRLREALALLPRSHRVDINPQEPCQDRLTRTEQFPHPLDLPRPAHTSERWDVVRSHRQPFTLQAFCPQDLGCLLDGRKDLCPG